MSPASAINPNAAPAFGNSHPVVARAPRAALHAELLGVWTEGAAFYVVVRLGSGSVILPCQRDDLRSFARFRRMVLTERGVEIYSDSQVVGPHAVRRDAWRDEVRRAERRGAAA